MSEESTIGTVEGLQETGCLGASLEQEVQHADLVLERRRELWVLRVAVVIAPPDLDAMAAEQVLVEIRPGTWSGNVLVRACGQAEGKQALAPPFGGLVV